MGRQSRRKPDSEIRIKPCAAHRTHHYGQRIWAAFAFDSKGNLYVANQGTSTITEYDPSTKAQIPARTLANGISSPKWLAIDGVDDIWVNNGFQSVNVYSADETFIKTLQLRHPGAIAVHGGFLDIGSGTGQLNMVLQQELVSNNQIGIFYTGVELIGCCYDANGNNYHTDAGTNTILFDNHAISATSAFAFASPAPFSPDGIAADIAHSPSSSAAGTPAKSPPTPRRAPC